jgi:hypothetical protein
MIGEKKNTSINVYQYRYNSNSLGTIDANSRELTEEKGRSQVHR